MSPAADRRWLTLAIVGAAFFMTVLDVAIVNVAIPSIQTDLNVTETTVQWVIIAYAITFGGFLLLGGRMADLLGRKRIFLVGLVLFTLASLVCGLANSISRADRRARGAGHRRRDHLARRPVDRDDDVRGGRRAEQGAGDLGRAGRLGRRGGRALRRDPDQVSRLGVDLLRQRPGRRARARADAAVRPREHVPSWAITASTWPARSPSPAGWRCCVYAISKAPDVGWGSAQTILLLLASIAILAVFVLIERRSSAPLVPFRIFRIRPLLGANVVGFLLGAVIFANFLVLTLYVQQVLGWSARQDRSHVPRDRGDGRDLGRCRPGADDALRPAAGDHDRDADPGRRAWPGTPSSRWTATSGPTCCRPT